MRKVFLLKGLVYSVLLLGTTAYAEGFKGFYFGGDLGYRWGDSNYSLSEITTDFSYKNDASEKVGFGSFFAGYGYLFENNFYVGGELEASFYPGNGDSWDPITEQRIYKEEISADYGYNFSLLPGYVVAQDFLVYGRMGIGQTRYTNKSYTRGKMTSSEDAWSAAEYRVGGGIGYKLTEHLSLRAEYNYIDSSTFDLNNDQSYQTELKPKYNEVTFGLQFTL